MPGSIRIVMMATGPFARPTFRALVAGRDDVVALVTRPVPSGRKRSKIPENPMRDAAAELELEILEPSDVNQPVFAQQLQALRPDLLVVCDYGQILATTTLALAPLGGINLHGSLLPRYRGAAPVNWAIYHGERETGVSVIHMTPRLDAGPCLVQCATRIEADETAPELEQRLASLGVESVQEAIRMLKAWDRKSPLGIVQDAARATRAPRLKKEDGAIRWNRSAIEIANQVRAFKPWPNSYTHWQRDGDASLRLIIDAAAVRPQQDDALPGTVVRADEEIWVATGEGCLAVQRIQPAGKRVLSSDSFLRGYALAAGARLA